MKELLKQGFTIIFARGFIRMAQLISFVLLARFLTPAEFGYFGIVTSAIPLAAMLGSLGLRQSFAYEIGQKRLLPGDAIATMLAAWPVLAALSAIAAFYAIGPEAGGLSGNSLAAIVGLGVFGTMFIMLAQGMFLGRGEIGRFSFVETLPRVLLAVLVVALVLLQRVTLENSLWLYSISFVFIVPVSLILVLRGVSGFKVRLAALPRMAGYGLAFALNLSMVLLNVRIGVFLLERLSGAEAAGLYFAASRVNEIFVEAATAFGLVIFSRAVRTDGGSDIIRQNARITCWIFWCFLLGGLAVAAVAPWLVPLVLGGGYAGAVPLLQIAALALGPAAAVKIIYPSIAGQGRPWIGTVILALTLGLNVLAAWTLIGGMGAEGAAFFAATLLAGEGASLAMYSILLKLKFDVPMRALFLPSRADAASLAAALRQAVSRGRK